MTETVVLKNGAVMDKRTGRIVAHHNPPFNDAVIQGAAVEKARIKALLAKKAGIITEVVISRVFNIAKGEL